MERARAPRSLALQVEEDRRARRRAPTPRRRPDPSPHDRPAALSPPRGRLIRPRDRRTRLVERMPSLRKLATLLERELGTRHAVAPGDDRLPCEMRPSLLGVLRRVRRGSRELFFRHAARARSAGLRRARRSRVRLDRLAAELSADVRVVYVQALRARARRLPASLGARRDARGRGRRPSFDAPRELRSRAATSSVGFVLARRSAAPRSGRCDTCARRTTTKGSRSERARSGSRVPSRRSRSTTDGLRRRRRGRERDPSAPSMSGEARSERR